MTALAVHQFIPTFAARSAVGNHTLAVRSLLHDLGLASEVYVGEATPEMAASSRPFRSYADDARSDGSDVLLYQASTGSAMAEFLLQRREAKVVNYHNLTPVSLFGPWEPQVGAELALGRQQLADLAPATSLGIAVSSYNRAELDALGYARTEVVPLLVDLAAFDANVDGATLERLRAVAGSAWLFVGRIAPNKAQHDLIKAFSVYRRLYDPAARLRLVGGSSSHAYSTALQRFRFELGLDDAVELVGEVSDAELAAHYRAADVFVCASDHEGFCIPLLEAMHHELPIVAYASAAVPETLADAGIVLAEKSPALVAAAVHRVVTDGALRSQLTTAGHRRLADFELARTRERFAAALAPLVGAAS